MTSKVHTGVRRAFAVLFWGVLAACLFREGAEQALRMALVRVLQVPAPDATFSLLGLRAESPGGRGTWHDVEVRWQGVRMGLLSGGSVDSLELGPALAPILRVRDMTVLRVWPLLVGQVARVEVSPVRPEWRRVARGAGGGRPWELTLPVRMSTRALTIRLPAGNWQGPAAVEARGNGGQGQWSGELRGGGLRIEASGRWSREGVEAQAVGLSGGAVSAYGSAQWGRSGLDLKCEAVRGEERWTAEARGREGESLRVALTHDRRARRTEILSFRLAPGARSADWPAVESMVGAVGLPDLILGRKVSIREGALSADPQGAAMEGETCVALLASGRIVAPERSYLLRSGLKVRRVQGVGVEGSFEGQASPAPTPRLGDSAPPLLWRFDGRSTDSETILDSRVDLGQGRLQARVASERGVWTWAGTLDGPFGGMTGEGEWRDGTWRHEGRCDFPGRLPGPASWPLPVGPLVGTFALKGDRDGLSSFGLKASGSGSWNISEGRLSGWRAEVRNGELKGTAVTVKGLDLRAVGVRWQELIDKAPLQASLSARACLFGGEKLSGLSAEVARRGGEIRARVAATLDSLEGKSAFTLLWGGPGKNFQLTDGELDLAGGAVHFGTIRASWPGRLEESASWTSGAARIFGEPLKEVSGSCSLDATGGGVILTGAVKHWGGEVNARLPLGGPERPVLVLDVARAEAAPIFPYIKQWVDLPLRAKTGAVDGKVSIPLDDATEGLHFEAAVRDVDLEVNGPAHTLPKVGGRIVGRLGEGMFAIPETAVSLDGGKAQATLSIQSQADRTLVRFATPSTAAERLSAAAFDFLPEALGYGTLQGTASVAGSLVVEAGAADLTLTVNTDGLGFLSEDKALRVKGLKGSLVLPVSLTGAGPALPGFSNPSRPEHAKTYASLASAPAGSSFTVERLRFSVFTADNLRVNERVEGRSLSLQLTDSDLWGGGLRGQFRVGISGEGVRYAGQFLAKNASLAGFCTQAGTLRGFISGTADASLTVAGETLEMSKAKALADLWVDREGPEAMVISRDFLVKMGGEQIRRLLHSDRMNYDRAALRCGLNGGVLTVYELDLANQANPVKALMRKDVSFEVKVPERNSIALDQLVRNIKNLEVKAGVSTGASGRPKRTR